MGIEYDRRDEYEKEVYTSSINHVIRLLTEEERASYKIPNISSLLGLRSIGGDSIAKFLHRQIESFAQSVTGDINTMDCYYVMNDGIKVVMDMDEETLESEEYFFPNELLAMSGYDAKELYTDTLAKLEEDKKQRYIKNLKNEIRLQENSLAESELLGNKLPSFLIQLPLHLAYMVSIGRRLTRYPQALSLGYSIPT